MPTIARLFCHCYLSPPLPASPSGPLGILSVALTVAEHAGAQLVTPETHV